MRKNQIKKVPEAGLEPARCHHRGILSPLRLPIPSLGHLKLLIYNREFRSCKKYRILNRGLFTTFFLYLFLSNFMHLYIVFYCIL